VYFSCSTAAAVHNECIITVSQMHPTMQQGRVAVCHSKSVMAHTNGTL
jgi:hypothetical protein